MDRRPIATTSSARLPSGTNDMTSPQLSNPKHATLQRATGPLPKVANRKPTPYPLYPANLPPLPPPPLQGKEAHSSTGYVATLTGATEPLPRRYASSDGLSARYCKLQHTMDPVREAPAFLPSQPHSIAKHEELRRHEMQARGPADRQESDNIRDFLTITPTSALHEQDRQFEYLNTPKSHFSWSENGDNQSIHQRDAFQLRFFKRAHKRAEITDAVLSKNPRAAGVKNILPSSPLASTQETSTPTSPQSDAASVVVRRTSLLKTFTDPVWKTDDKDVLGFMRRRTNTESSQPASIPSPLSSFLRASVGSKDSIAKNSPTGKSAFSISTPTLLGPKDGTEEDCIDLFWNSEDKGKLISRQHAMSLFGSEAGKSSRSSHNDFDTPPKRPITSPSFLSLHRLDTNGSTDELLSPGEALAQRLKDSPNVSRAKGFPRSPEDPDWDHAVKYARKMVKEADKKDKEEAKRLGKEISETEKKIRKLNAGKHIISRGSQLGLATRKPLDSITEEEFETIGAFAIAPPGEDAPIAKKSSKLGSLFTRIRGDGRERDEHVERTQEKLNRHRSLVLLDSADAADLLRGFDEDRTRSQLDAALKILSGISPAPVPDITTSQRKIQEKTGVLIRRSRPESNRAMFRDSLGLGIFDILDDPMSSSPTPSNSPSLDDIPPRPPKSYLRSPSAWWNHPHGAASAETLVPPGNGSSVSLAESRPSRVPGFRNQGEAPDSGSWSSDSVYSAELRPEPLNIPLLKVKTSMAHIQPADANSFIPDRQASFRAKIEAVSDVRRDHIGESRHPAFRYEELDIHSDDSPPASLKFDLDSPTSPRRMSETTLVGSMEDSDIEQEIPPEEDSIIGRAHDGDVDLNALRSSFGLGPLRIACAPMSPAHPAHPYTWDHEKIMCRHVHSGAAARAQTIDSPTAGKRIISKSSMNSPTKQENMRTKPCSICGALCCHFAQLLIHSKLKTGGDPEAERVRMKAQDQVTQLANQFSNGLDDYDTFVTCKYCKNLVCPTCGRECAKKGCHTVVCSGCGSEDGMCPAHNFF